MFRRELLLAQVKPAFRAEAAGGQQGHESKSGQEKVAGGDGVADGTRTRNSKLHKLGLYH